jgi:sec-independent protein translocase protein TatB
MFDIGASELLLIVIIAVIAVGPKEIPNALRTAGRWIAKVRKVSGHFRTGVETMIREAELDEMEKQWREQNAAIMATHPPASAAAEAAIAGPNPGTPELTDAPDGNTVAPQASEKPA